MRQLKIDFNIERLMRVRGTGRWARFGDGWLCAHDILHHLPQEAGTPVEEIMTFGAELWSEYPTMGVDAITPWHMGDPLAESYTGRSTPRQYVLPEVPLNFRRPPDKYMERFQLVAEQGMKECTDNVLSHYFDVNDKELAPTWRERLAGSDNVRRAADWMAFGYRVAQRRFPDAVAASALFKRLESALENVPYFRKQVTLSLDERQYEFSIA